MVVADVQFGKHLFCTCFGDIAKVIIGEHEIDLVVVCGVTKDLPCMEILWTVTCVIAAVADDALDCLAHATDR